MSVKRPIRCQTGSLWGQVDVPPSRPRWNVRCLGSGVYIVENNSCDNGCWSDCYYGDPCYYRSPSANQIASLETESCMKTNFLKIYHKLVIAHFSEKIFAHASDLSKRICQMLLCFLKNAYRSVFFFKLNIWEKLLFLTISLNSEATCSILIVSYAVTRISLTCTKRSLVTYGFLLTNTKLMYIYHLWSLTYLLTIIIDL